MRRATKTFTEFTNNLYVTSVGMFPKGHFSLRLILAYEECTNCGDGYITSQYSLKSKGGAVRGIKDKFKIEVVDENTKKLAVSRNEGQHFKLYMFQSEEPLRFTDDGKVLVDGSDAPLAEPAPGMKSKASGPVDNLNE